MKYADDLIERILLLEGLPNLQELGKIFIGENPIETLSCDIKAEEAKDNVLIEAIALAEEKQDYVSRALLQELKDHNEDHWDWLLLQVGINRGLR